MKKSTEKNTNTFVTNGITAADLLAEATQDKLSSVRQGMIRFILSNPKTASIFSTLSKTVEESNFEVYLREYLNMLPDDLLVGGARVRWVPVDQHGRDVFCKGMFKFSFASLDIPDEKVPGRRYYTAEVRISAQNHVRKLGGFFDQRLGIRTDPRALTDMDQHLDDAGTFKVQLLRWEDFVRMASKNPNAEGVHLSKIHLGLWLEDHKLVVSSYGSKIQSEEVVYDHFYTPPRKEEVTDENSVTTEVEKASVSG